MAANPVVGDCWEVTDALLAPHGMFIGEGNIEAEDGSRGACVKVIDLVMFSGTLKLATFNTVDVDGRLDSNLSGYSCPRRSVRN